MPNLLFNCISYVGHIWAAVASMIHYFFVMVILRRPVSYPGDPIAKPLERRGDWPRGRKQFPLSSKGEWIFACDGASHEISQKFAPKFQMTGESAGRQIWTFDEGSNESPSKDHSTGEILSFDPSINPNSADKLFRKIMIEKWQGPKPSKAVPKTAKDAAKKALAFYQMLQCEDGHWAGDYGGPMFLMPGLIATLHITKAPFPDWRKEGMVTYLRNHQQTDGGWGTHIECASTMFGTILSYISLRLLGQESDQDYMKRARKFIIDHGGALYAPSWAKFWMAVLGIYDWDGINSIPAEMWFLPRWFPLHPGKMWCHCRMVYLPMCYVYCKRFVPDVSNDPVLQELRRELYDRNYDDIKWNDFRQTCCEIDTYAPLQPVMKIAQDFLSYYEWVLPYCWPLKKFREAALAFVIDYIHAEDLQTNFVDIGPVNKALNMLSVWIDSDKDNNCKSFQMHIPRVDDYLWTAEDGVKMQGYNGSQCWDTSFAIQAIVEGDLVQAFPQCALNVYSYLERTQIADNEDNREYYYRHESRGGWPFSTAAHGWPISDCTAEGLKGVLSLHHEKLGGFIPDEMKISDDRLADACNILLSYQNLDGGWATYENNRGFGWYEKFNPSEVFGDIMIDYSYVECSSASITALKQFSKAVPSYRPDEVARSIKRGGAFLKSIQRYDGSWYGSWGVCFTYGTWFGIEGLVAAGEPVDCHAIKKAVKFLLGKQNANGGWGESYVACVDKAYPSDGTGAYGEGQSGVVQTAWALLGLLAAECSDKIAVDKGIKFIMQKQLPSGDWDQEGITGVFNRSCGITYTAYRNVFPMWALARYGNAYDK